MTRPKPVVLVVLDGWGKAPEGKGNAITLAQTPFIDNLEREYPTVLLDASGEAVGLPKDEDGNTETGHLNIGAGRLVHQDLPRINNSIADGSFFENQTLLQAIDHVRKHNSKLHIMGLVGDGGVHSHVDHLYALLKLCKRQEIGDRVIVHPITDGRDSPPKKAVEHLDALENKMTQIGVGKIGVVMGRYYAMDRDMRWERTKIAYEAYTMGVGTATDSLSESMKQSYDKGFTDEFIKPLINTDSQTGEAYGLVEKSDAVIFFNFRIDRPRQLTKAFVYPRFDYVSTSRSGFDPYAIKYYGSHLAGAEYATKPFDRGELIEHLFFCTMTEYESGLPVHVAFPPESIDNPLGEVIAKHGLRQLRMAETEKERFVTFYLNGQREDPYPGEDRIIIPSPPVATYDAVPAMSSRELTQTLLDRLESNNYDFIAVNYANPDMVAHTGVLAAGIEAAQITDQNIKTLVTAVLSVGGSVVISADHGNLEEMLDPETGGIDTEHSTFPVPCIIVDERVRGKRPKLDKGSLPDIAPTILELMGIEVPEQMTGKVLVEIS